jgi:hypothetical protein
MLLAPAPIRPLDLRAALRAGSGSARAVLSCAPLAAPLAALRSFAYRYHYLPLITPLFAPRCAQKLVLAGLACRAPETESPHESFPRNCLPAGCFFSLSALLAAVRSQSAAPGLQQVGRFALTQAHQQRLFMTIAEDFEGLLNTTTFARPASGGAIRPRREGCRK